MMTTQSCSYRWPVIAASASASACDLSVCLSVCLIFAHLPHPTYVYRVRPYALLRATREELMTGYYRHHLKVGKSGGNGRENNKSH